MQGLMQVVSMLESPLGEGLELLGMIGFALTGALMARDEHAPWSMSLVVTFAIGFGGGILRDLIASRTPLWATSHPEAIVAVLLTWVLVVGIPSSIKVPLWVRWVAVILDSLAVVLFIFSSSFVAVSYQTQPILFWAPAFSAVTAFGGGMIARSMLGRVLISPQAHRVGVVGVLLLGALCTTSVGVIPLVSLALGMLALLVWLSGHTLLQPPS